MNTNRDEYLHLIQAAKKCQLVFIKQDTAQFESAATSLIASYQQCKSALPNVEWLTLNLFDSQLDYFSNLLLKQVAISSRINSQLSYQPSASNSNNLASLLVLFALFPVIVTAKKQPSEIPLLKKHLSSASTKAFVIGKHIKLSDQDSLKLLSQIARKNRYHCTNQFSQTTVLLCVNSNLLAHLGLFQPISNINSALSKQLASCRFSAIHNPWLANFLPEFLPLVSISTLTGSVAIDKNKRKLLLVEYQNIEGSNNGQWLCLSLSEKLSEQLEYINAADLRVLAPQQKISVSKLLSHLSSNTENKTSTQTKCSDNNTALKYQAPDEWRTIAQTLLLNNADKLANTLNKPGLPEQYKTNLLQYASELSRENVAITDVKHAINLLGIERVYPITLTSALKARAAEFRYNSSDLIQYKSELFCQLVSGHTKVTAAHRSITSPEFMSVVSRLIFLALMSIPKANFAAASQTNINHDSNTSKQSPIALHQLYKLSNATTWYKITIALAQKWYLPNYHQSLIKAFFKPLLANSDIVQHSDTKNKNREKHVEEVKILQQASLIFSELTQSNSVSPTYLMQSAETTSSTIDNLLQATDKREANHDFLKQLHLYTPLC
ncbi:MAG: hypothetical protein HWE10_05680 [Gammaproteobacteria bacterium]|nr:hypothetical protein [Gammaproteobacteria bacterium]